QLLKTVFDTIPHSLFVRDANSVFVMANRVLANRYHLEPEDLMGRHVTEIPVGSEQQRAQFLADDRLALETGRPVIHEEIPILQKDGTTRLFKTSTHPLRFDSGEIMGLVGITEDVTARKTLEEQLRQSQKMEALGTLAGGIAHDFNNILSPILGFSELLMAKAENPGQFHSYATEIFGSAQRAKELVAQILLFGRRALTEKNVTNLSPLVRDVVKFARSTLPKTISLQEEISTAEAHVFCDASQIHQVLLNLCVNVGQAIRGIGEIHVALGTVELDGFECFTGKLLSGKYVRIAVTDNGVGIDPETLGHIFEPFFTTKGVGEGTGLGLSTVFGIVADHGGGFGVSTELGKGTTFEVFLPLAGGAAEEPPAVANRVQDQGSGNILFVDDEEPIAKLGKISLERFGYTVTAAMDGRQALEIFAAAPAFFDLVVTDRTMPNMTGETLAQQLRKLRPDLPIILCTGHGEAISAESSEAIGIGSVLYKPIAPSELGRVVRELLDRAGPA
ncbi:MAG: ATP-binding protein, partial [bacterium]